MPYFFLSFSFFRFFLRSDILLIKITSEKPVSSLSVLTRDKFQSTHQQRALLLQFILYELILSHQEIQHINDFAKTFDSSDPPSLDIIAPSLAKLAGSAHGYMRLFSWNDDGIQTKLKNYCALLCQNGSGRIKNEVGMHREANQAWLISLQLLDTIRLQDTSTKKTIHLLQSLFKKLDLSTKRFARYTANAILLFHNDENLLFFILRYKEGLDKIYGDGYLAKALRKMFPRSLDKAKNFLVQRYTDRGFDHLIPIIQEKIEELKK